MDRQQMHAKVESENLAGRNNLWLEGGGLIVNIDTDMKESGA